jgi:hypothetical protein
VFAEIPPNAIKIMSCVEHVICLVTCRDLEVNVIDVENFLDMVLEIPRPVRVTSVKPSIVIIATLLLE